MDYQQWKESNYETLLSLYLDYVRETGDEDTRLGDWMLYMFSQSSHV